MPGLLKIGFTTRSVEERVAELDSSTSVPSRFEIAFYFACSEPQSDEVLAHEAFVKYRLNQGREFFKITDTEALAILRERLARHEVFLNPSLHKYRAEFGPELHGLDECLRNEVLSLRNTWSTTAGTANGISLIYRLMSEQHYSDAKKVVELFLEDNPGHGVALKQRTQVEDALKKGKG